jgi:hypothetical protein
MSHIRQVGLVGIENSHAEEIIRYLNIECNDGPVRVSAIVRGEPGRTTDVAQLGSIDTVVDGSGDLLGAVDALIVTSRDGAMHAQHAVPFLERGTPVWVDKPLAASIADAEAIVAAGERGGGMFTSSSALRWVPDTTAILEDIATIGPLQALTVTGPADPDSKYSGIFFYGIHAADVAQRLIPGRPSTVDVRLTAGAVIAQYRISGILVTLELIRPDADRSVPFRASAIGRHGVVRREITLPDDYVRPGADAFITMLRSGVPPIPVSEMLAPIAILDSVRTQLAAARQ